MTQRPVTQTRKSRSFSFRSDKSHGSNKLDLHETSAEKEAKRLHSKADPSVAMNEAEPCKSSTPHALIIFADAVHQPRSLRHTERPWLRCVASSTRTIWVTPLVRCYSNRDIPPANHDGSGTRSLESDS